MVQTSDPVVDKPSKFGIKAAFQGYLYVEYKKWIALNPDKKNVDILRTFDTQKSMI